MIFMKRNRSKKMAGLGTKEKVAEVRNGVNVSRAYFILNPK